MASFPITSEGFVALEAELKDLKSRQRPEIVEAIAEAREHGDLSENAEYHAAREKQSFIEGRIAELEDKLARAEVIEVAKLTGDTVKFGAVVTLADEEDNESTYQIVGEYEADIEQKKISFISPIARALIGKTKGDFAEVQTPRGVVEYEILEVKFS